MTVIICIYVEYYSIVEPSRAFIAHCEYVYCITKSGMDPVKLLTKLNSVYEAAMGCVYCGMCGVNEKCAMT